MDSSGRSDFEKQLFGRFAYDLVRVRVSYWGFL
jgi:uncharacterized protein (DUF2252 family)